MSILSQLSDLIFLSLDYRPSPKAAIFIAFIVKVPMVQMSTIALAVTILCIEFPLPRIKKMSLYRSLLLRVVLLIFQASLTILFYQVCFFFLLLGYSFILADFPFRGLMQRFGR